MVKLCIIGVFFEGGGFNMCWFEVVIYGLVKVKQIFDGNYVKRGEVVYIVMLEVLCVLYQKVFFQNF